MALYFSVMKNRYVQASMTDRRNDTCAKDAPASVGDRRIKDMMDLPPNLSDDEYTSLETTSLLNTTAIKQQLFDHLALISHEIRTPLSIINGTASTLLRQQQHLSPQELLEFFQMIQQAGKRMEILTDRLLELAQLEAGILQIEAGRVDLIALIKEAITRTQHSISTPAQSRFSFHLQCRDMTGSPTQEVPEILGDAHCIRTVLLHLLENAVRFSPEGGRIDVIVRPAPGEQTTNTTEQPLTTAQFLEICVCDYGIGIPSEQLKDIFGHFYQVEAGLTREGSGLGIGLTICQHLIALHHGRIWAESCPAGGSAFHVWLPRAELVLVD
jgi:two-component system sensor histidine kinase ResE